MALSGAVESLFVTSSTKKMNLLTFLETPSTSDIDLLGYRCKKDTIQDGKQAHLTFPLPFLI